MVGMKEDLENFDRQMGHRTYQVSVPINRLRECWERRPWKKPAPIYKPDEIDRAIDKAINEADRT